MIILPNRLQTAASFCREGKIAADIGCDSAALSCWLAKNVSREVIASDLRDGPLKAAKRTVSGQNVSNVKVIKSDGLREIDYADDVIICGMGGELIGSIIAGCRFLSRDTRFILQPMTKAEVLRRWLYRNGFELIEERTAYDFGRAYCVMLGGFCGEKREIDDVFAFSGKIKDSGFLKMIANKLLKSAEGMEKSQNCRQKAAEYRETAKTILEKAEKLK